jgi:pimeloyl-ACP methyl ester carboxylesterase
MPTMPEVTLPQGTVHYRDSGPRDADVLLFVHGLLVDGSLWDGVVERLDDRRRCIVPDLPLGSHPTPMRPDADLSPRGIADLLDAFCAALGLDRVTIVANDTGGAITQIAVTEHPARFDRLVLTPCDAFDNFLPPMFRPLQWLAHVPPLLAAAVQAQRVDAVRRSPMAFGGIAKHRPPGELLDRWLAPALGQRAIRRDVAKLLRGIDARDTLAAAARLKGFTGPALLAWAPEQRTFPLEHARRLAEILPDARVVTIDDAWAFIPLDQPAALAGAIAAFLDQTDAGAAGAGSASAGSVPAGTLPAQSPNSAAAS